MADGQHTKENFFTNYRTMYTSPQSNQPDNEHMVGMPDPELVEMVAALNRETEPQQPMQLPLFGAPELYSEGGTVRFRAKRNQ